MLLKNILLAPNKRLENKIKTSKNIFHLLQPICFSEKERERERKKEREKELNTSVYYLYTSCILVVHELYTSVIRRYKIPSPYFISLRRGVQPTTTTTTSPSSLSIQLGDCLEQNKDVIFELFWCSTHTYTPAVRRPLFKLKLRQWKMVLIGKKLEEQIF